MAPRFRTAVSAAVALGMGHLLWVSLGVGGPAAAQAGTRAAVAAASLATALACAHTAARSRSHVRRGWGLLSLSAGWWFLGNGAAAWQELGGAGPLPVPWPANALSTAGLVPAVLAVLFLLDPVPAPVARLRTVLDSLLVASSLLFVGWALVLGDLHSAVGQARGGLLALAPPVAAVVLASVVLVALARAGSGSRMTWWLLLGGTGFFAVSQGASAQLHVAGTGVPAALPGAAWVWGCAIIFLAPLCPRKVLRPLPAEAPAATLLPALLPYVPVGLAAAVAAGTALDGGFDPFLVGNGVVVVLLLVVRQVLGQVDNWRLARQVDARVRERTAALERRERQLRALLHNASDVLTVVGPDNFIRYQSASVRRVLGFAPRELVGTRIDDLLHPDERDDALARLRSAPPSPGPSSVLEARLRRRNGGWCTAETTVTNLLDDESVRGFLLTSRDVGERKQLEKELRHQALHDPLTGLANRTLLLDRLEHAMARSARGPDRLALVMVDLDDFKQINDTLGHPAGDRVLVEVARRLFQGVRAGDTVARIGGDEFAVLLEQADEEALDVVAYRVRHWPRHPLEIDGKSVVIQGSVGVAMAETSTVGAGELLRNADLAMYVAKSRGKGSYEVFHSGMHADLLEQQRREGELRRALRRGELVLHYQPLVELPGGRISGAEALVRWDHPDHGLVPPGEFLPLAEQSELVLKIGRWALVEACRQARLWQEGHPGLRRLTMSVNVAAARQLTSPLFVADVRQALDESGLEPESLMLEITEAALMGDVSSIIPTLHALKELGVTLAIDDFGEGWSSLSRLRSFPVDKLKIDRSFVQEIRPSGDEASIVTAVSAMAHSLGVSTVAEGVETVEQLACLRDHGCHEVQGYLLSPPLPPAELEALVADNGGVMEVVAQALARPGLKAPSRRRREEEASGGARAVLTELRRVTGADSVYLTEVHPDRLVQEVRYACNGAGLEVPEGATMSWPGSPCGRVVGGGPRFVPDLGDEFSRHELVRAFGVVSLISVPVHRPDGSVYGTLCAADLAEREGGERDVVLLELFASLLEQRTGIDEQPAGSVTAP
ncbi:MAG: EAL domain-containing protein [Actinomycetota bacterium]|nr:EAL domain-containing protein [Actinomycetota bacterium]